MKAFRAFARPKTAWIGVFLLGLGLSVPAHSGPDGDQEDTVPALIIKVEGDGIARVKKAFGVEEAAGAGGKLFPGDKVITDSRSAVFIILNDGSVLKVGLSSEFKLEEAELHDRFLSWAFRLVKGSMRALVEKNAEPDTRLRIHTPGGTVGVRGTEFVVALDEEEKTTQLFMIEGLVAYGLPDCEKSNSCVEVRAGEMASMKEGQKEPPKPKAYRAEDLFGVIKGSDNRPAPSAKTDPRMSLFQDAKRVTSRFKQDMDDDTLKKLVEEASEGLAASQDRAIGRSKEQRIAMHNAIKDGTYKEIIAAANAYSEAKDLFAPDANDGAEDLLAQTAAAKFRLGLAVKEAAEAGAFGHMKVGKDGKLSVDWKDEKFQEVKNVDYDKAPAAKAKAAALKDAADDFNSVMEFAEAHPAPEKKGKKRGVGAAAAAAEEQPEAGTLEVKNTVDRETRRGRRGGTSAQALSEGTRTSVVATDRAGACKGRKCRIRALRHELSATSEGVLNAFHGGKSELGRPSSFSAAAANKGEVKTRYFRKSINGAACYREEKDCKMVPCPQFQQGKRCKKGESLQNCTTKKVPVRCPKAE